MLWLRLLPAALAASLFYASPALATVEDPLGLLGLNFDQALDTGIKNINEDKIDVVILRTLPTDANGMAELRFRERHMGPDGGVIMVGTETDNVGSYLGSDFTTHGVTPELVARLVARVYRPEAKRNMASEGLLALVRQIKLARTLGRDPERVPPRPQVATGLPWWWYVPPVSFSLVGLGLYLGMKRQRSLRRRARLRRLVDRLEDLQYQLKRQESAYRQLGEVATHGTPDPTLSARFEALQTEGQALARAAKAIGESIKLGAWEDAEQRLTDAESRLFPQACGLAGLLAAQQARLAGDDARQVLLRADQALARWNRLSEARARWATSSAGNGPQQLAERLEALARVLVTAPLDVAEADDYLDATEAIYSRALEPSGMSSRRL